MSRSSNRRRSRRKNRRLWLNVKYKVPPGTSKKKVLDTLIESIDNGTYTYPKTWKVVLEWRNKESAPMKAGEFQKEMLASQSSSDGWDSAVLSYLENQKG
jgi:hypothetical protein